MTINTSPPAHYDPDKPWTYSPSFTLKPRDNKSYFDPSKEVLSKPPPGTYNPKEDLVKTERFKNITLGKGEKFLGYYYPGKRK